MKKIIGVIIVTLFAIFSIRRDVSAVVNYNYHGNEYEVSLPEEAQIYLDKIKEDIIELIDYYSMELDIVGYNCSDIFFGEEFVIYNPEYATQEQKYYVPISCNNDILLTICLYNVNNSWTFNLSREYAEVLNEIDYGRNSESFIFYEANDGIVAENENETVVIEYFNNSNVICSEFYELAYEDKKIIITEAFKNVETIINNVEESSPAMEYSRDFAYYDAIEKRLALYNAQGQGKYALCWAASCSTIINYIKGTEVTAKDVANKMGIDYDAGAYIEQIKSALSKYNISYSKIENSQISLQRINANIEAKYPILAYAVRDGGAHTVIIYGFRKQYLLIWDSVLNGGEGGTYIIPYDSESTTIANGNYVYTWGMTLSYK